MSEEQPAKGASKAKYSAWRTQIRAEVEQTNYNLDSPPKCSKCGESMVYSQLYGYFYFICHTCH